jgi:hypothetical protein
MSWRPRKKYLLDEKKENDIIKDFQKYKEK